ncbi:hypothetical protein NEPAR06_1494 [Nematocida parisii]|uniref:Uncharacterized protein n=1 Tax=Nematocida parisii (strain ERTm3) TaxID=935791 RepID=I3EIP5_NEMP3|nr:uncharacterized protein NEPG_01696 [Nematocida parisii ERTm1]EIJ89092.1 hypothetical protein NEQG_00911 [Nematocida parisii ERTm3]KAI5125923.1 hypothetical protein NEPAR08_0259 [Nematocida parisii]EIJ93354.1 hypothetical protein NEPG_01696 [Nematocida parisii ERTm1]KAI5126188.1 hypothetical protein NEPAR03_0360 [Nematocida parisii]KAI5140433.1 hypothetical protein NEPAR04_0265 [Nematocida parisii]|eukprot:XP_013059524.1 hypothetical protein NEPG_01696 [Nematocida parisii ERTm1]
MDSLEHDLRTSIAALDEVVQRISTVNQIVENIKEFQRINAPERTETIEEYYLSEINKWILATDKKNAELEKKEKHLLSTQTKYLAALKKLKDLENKIQNTTEKYNYCKSQIEKLQK